jgi:hypothetical protein
MSPQEFVFQLNAVVVEENVATYRRLLLNTPIDLASDPYWRRVVKLCSELNADQREVLLELTRQVAIDTTANVLGVVDGVCPIGDLDYGLRLTYGDKDLGGDLQSLFLEQAEQAAP